MSFSSLRLFSCYSGDWSAIILELVLLMLHCTSVSSPLGLYVVIDRSDTGNIEENKILILA
jgi:hypothetical protein